MWGGVGVKSSDSHTEDYSSRDAGFRELCKPPSDWVGRALVCFTFRWSVGCCHNDDPVFEQIFKKLFQNHGVGDVSDLWTTTHLFYFNFTSANGSFFKMGVNSRRKILIIVRKERVDN